MENDLASVRRVHTSTSFKQLPSSFSIKVRRKETKKSTFDTSLYNFRILDIENTQRADNQQRLVGAQMPPARVQHAEAARKSLRVVVSEWHQRADKKAQRARALHWQQQQQQQRRQGPKRRRARRLALQGPHALLPANGQVRCQRPPRCVRQRRRRHVTTATASTAAAASDTHQRSAQSVSQILRVLAQSDQGKQRRRASSWNVVVGRSLGFKSDNITLCVTTAKREE